MPDDDRRGGGADAKQHRDTCELSDGRTATGAGVDGWDPLSHTDSRSSSKGKNQGRVPGEGTASRWSEPGSEYEYEVEDEAEAEAEAGHGLGDSDGEEEGEYVELDPTADNVAVEDGWDSGTAREQRVWDANAGRLAARPVAWTAAQIRHPRLGANAHAIACEKLLSVDDALAAGVLYLAPGSKKAPKSSRENTYVRSTRRRGDRLTEPGCDQLRGATPSAGRAERRLRLTLGVVPYVNRCFRWCRARCG